MDYPNKPLVSIIVPVYNSSSCIETCVTSLVKQSYKNLDIILVDDGSTDDSLFKCRILSSSDDRIKVYSKSNSGASSARNYGIEHAKGDWIVFVDSDDFVTSDYVAHLVEGAIKIGSDFVMAGIQYWYVYNDKHVSKTYDNVYLKDDSLVDSIIKYKIYENGGPVAKLYRKSIILNHFIRFNEKLHYAEDCDFMLKYVLQIDSMLFIEHADYIYRLTFNSLSHRKLPLQSEELCLSEMVQRYCDLSRKFSGASLIDYKVSLIQYYIRTLKSIANSKLSIIDKKDHFQSLYKKCKTNYLNEEFKAYQPYCFDERILSRLLWKGKFHSIIFYSSFIYPLLHFIHNLLK